MCVCVCDLFESEGSAFNGRVGRSELGESFRLLRRLCGESQRSICWRFRMVATVASVGSVASGLCLIKMTLKRRLLFKTGGGEGTLERGK